MNTAVEWCNCQSATCWHPYGDTTSCPPERPVPANRQERHELACQVVHIARKHRHDHAGPCKIEYPSGYTYCSGPSNEDERIVDALQEAGLLR